MAQDKDIRLCNYIWKIHASTYISADLLSMIMISTKYHPVGTIPKFNSNIVERGKTDTLKTPIHDRALCRLAQ